MVKTTSLAVVLSACLLALAACGDKGVTADDVTIANFRATVSSAVLGCTTDGDSGPAGADLLDGRVEEVIAIAKRDPDAEYQASTDDVPLSMRQVLSDAATDLVGCEPDVAAQLSQAVETISG